MQRVGEGVRWCPSCEHEVHDLGELDEEQARALLRAHRGRSLCVRYTTDHEGRLRFASPALSVDRLVRRPRVTAFVLAATVSLVLIAGCASTRAKGSAPVAYPDPWIVTVDFALDPDQDAVTGMFLFEDPFLDPEVLELEDDIIPEVITARKR
jgi:hypothetical protein